MLRRHPLDEGNLDLDYDLVEEMRPLARVLLMIARRKLAKVDRDDQIERMAA